MGGVGEGRRGEVSGTGLGEELLHDWIIHGSRKAPSRL